jgi:hypothetical protein
VARIAEKKLLRLLAAAYQPPSLDFYKIYQSPKKAKHMHATQSRADLRKGFLVGILEKGRNRNINHTFMIRN